MALESDIVSLRITLRYKDLDEFATRYAENISSAGLFLRTKSPKPTGTKIRFELLLADGTRALRGEGVVVTVREDEKAGMALRFNVLDAESNALIARIVEKSGQGPLAPTPLSTRFGKSVPAAEPALPKATLPMWRPQRGAPSGWTPISSAADPLARKGSAAAGGVLPRRPIRSFGPGAPTPPPVAEPEAPSRAASESGAETVIDTRKAEAEAATEAPPGQEEVRSALPRTRSSASRPWAAARTSPATYEPTQRIRARNPLAPPMERTEQMSLGPIPEGTGEESETLRLDVANLRHEAPTEEHVVPRVEEPSRPEETAAAGATQAELTQGATTDDLQGTPWGSEEPTHVPPPPPETERERALTAVEAEVRGLEVRGMESIEARALEPSPDLGAELAAERAASARAEEAAHEEPIERTRAAFVPETTLSHVWAEALGIPPTSPPDPSPERPGEPGEAERSRLVPKTAEDQAGGAGAPIGDAEAVAAQEALAAPEVGANVAAEAQPIAPPTESAPEVALERPEAIERAEPLEGHERAERFEPAEVLARRELDDRAETVARHEPEDRAEASTRREPEERAETVATRESEHRADAFARREPEERAETVATRESEHRADAFAPRELEERAETVASHESEHRAEAFAPRELEERAETVVAAEPHVPVPRFDAVAAPPLTPSPSADEPLPSEYRAAPQAAFARSDEPIEAAQPTPSGDIAPPRPAGEPEPAVDDTGDLDEDVFHRVPQERAATTVDAHPPTFDAMAVEPEATTPEAASPPTPAREPPKRMPTPPPPPPASESETEIVQAFEAGAPKVEPRPFSTDVVVTGLGEPSAEATPVPDIAPSHRPPPRTGPYRAVIERESSSNAAPDPAERRVPVSDFSEEVTEYPAAPPERRAPPIPRPEVMTPRETAVESGGAGQETAPGPGRKYGSGQDVRRESQPAARAQTDVASSRTFGIDFGGRWIRIGVSKRGELELIQSGGSSFLPALIAVRADGTLAFGAKARSIAADDPQRVISPRAVLRAMRPGGAFQPPAGVPASLESGRIVVRFGGRTFDFREMLAAFFASLHTIIVGYAGDERGRAVISIPNDLAAEARTLIKDAASDAKLPVAALLTEAEAMIRAYHLDEQLHQAIMMVDVGATHIGLTIARRDDEGRLLTTSSKWIESLSAAELDARVVDLTLQELATQAKEDHRSDPAARIRLLDAVEKARIDLRRSTVVELKVSLPAPGGASNVGFERSIKLPRSRIYQVTEELIGQICGRVQEFVKESGLHPHSIDALVLAGSGGVFPPLVEALTTLFDKEPLTTIPPSNVFVVGLSRAGAALERSENASRPDALSAGIGIGLPGGRFLPLLRAGEQLPIHLKRKHSTTRDNQTEIELHFYQGDAELVRNCAHLGVIMLAGVPRGPRGTVQVDLSIDVDMTEVATFTLSEETTGASAKLVVATREAPDQRRKAQAAQAGHKRVSETAEKPPQKRGFFARLLGRS